MRSLVCRALGSVPGPALIAWMVLGTSCAKARPSVTGAERCAGWEAGIGIHRCGIMDATSADFHGRLIRDTKYDFGVCQKCHGGDFGGGSSGVSCLGCHAEGPTACSTCHGAIAASGSHGRHLGGGPLEKAYGCAECHVVPAAYTDAGHLFRSDGSLDPPPAEVALGAAASRALPGDTRPAPPSYDPATRSCSAVYCHQPLAADGAAANPHPVWSEPGTGQADCGACHGLPPNHSGPAACAGCHPSVAGMDQTVIAPDLHIDGRIELADAAAGCGGCHGTAADPAPPPDVTGGTAPAGLGVGAHQAHVHATAGLRGPIACGECHLVPADPSSPGHFSGHASPADESPGAEVFPAEAGVGVLASSDGAAPRWDRATATCSGVYCHGGGSALAADLTTSAERVPRWTAAGALACGAACHGVPPTFPPHLPSMSRVDCAGCHPGTVSSSGAIIVSGPPGLETSAHINGVLDVAP